MSVGVGVGLVFLAREGLSFAMLRSFESGDESEEDSLSGTRPSADVPGGQSRDGRSARAAGRSPCDRDDDVVAMTET
jgi:hypothetical protein